MTSTKELFRPLDDVTPPDLTGQIGEPPLRGTVQLEPPRRRRPALAAAASLIVTALIVGGLVSAFRSNDSSPGTSLSLPSNGLVAYIGREGVRLHVFLADVAGGQAEQITFGDVRDYWPSWSPDGSKIAFARMDLSDGGIRLAVLDLASREVTYITDASVAPSRSDWAPDGSEIAFARDGRVGESGIWAVRPDGTGLRRLAGADMIAPDEPHWSPDGRELAFSGNTEPDANNWDVYIVNADGSNLRHVTPTRGAGPSELVIDWIPDGSGLYASVGPDGGPQEWVTMDRTGSIVERVYAPHEHDQAPALSPDGRSFVFAGYAEGAEGPDGAFVLDLGSAERRHVAEELWVWPAWQPVFAGSSPSSTEAAHVTHGSAAPSAVDGSALEGSAAIAGATDELLAAYSVYEEAERNGNQAATDEAWADVTASRAHLRDLLQDLGWDEPTGVGASPAQQAGVLMTERGEIALEIVGASPQRAATVDERGSLSAMQSRLFEQLIHVDRTLDELCAEMDSSTATAVGCGNEPRGGDDAVGHD